MSSAALAMLMWGMGCGGTAGNRGEAPCAGEACPPTPDGHCTHFAIRYEHGDDVPSIDECEQCACNDGQVACSRAACGEAPCMLDGALLASGETFMGEDGCTACSCFDGEIGCSALYCGYDADDCSYQGQVWRDGQSFVSTDGCSSCMCSKGEVSCDMTYCDDGPSCMYAGQVISSGGSLPAGDGCNTCSCFAGQIACTLAYCPVRCAGDAQCSEGEYCASPEGVCGVDGGGSFDSELPPGDMRAPVPPGTCQPRAQECVLIEAPVCGCNGVTYGNSCVASSAGANVSHQGECP